MENLEQAVTTKPWGYAVLNKLPTRGPNQDSFAMTEQKGLARTQRVVYYDVPLPLELQMPFYQFRGAPAEPVSETPRVSGIRFHPKTGLRQR